MLVSNFNKQYQFKKIDEYECPHTIVYSISGTASPFTHGVSVHNTLNTSAAVIDWGDGTIESLKSDEDHFAYFDHEYSNPGEYIISFDMNSDGPLRISSSFFTIGYYSGLYTSGYASIAEGISNSTNTTIEVLDYNSTDIGDAMNQSYSPFSCCKAIMSNKVLHRIKKSKNAESYDSIKLRQIKSSTRDLVFSYHNLYKASHVFTDLPNFDTFNPYNKNNQYKLGYRAFNYAKLPSLHVINDNVFLDSHSQFNHTTLTNIDMSDLSVTELPNYLFDSSSISSIILPRTLISIPFKGFFKCTNLKTAYGYNGIRNVKMQAFEACYGLTTVTLPSSVVNLEANCFNGCYNLTTVDMHGAKIKTINNWAFNNCNKLSALNIDYDSIGLIKPHGFDRCLFLVDPTFANLTRIEDYAFSSCSNLSSLSADELCFYGDYSLSRTGLSSYSFPSTELEIGNSVFDKTPISEITLNSIPESISMSAFTGITGNCTIYLPWSENEYEGYPWGADTSKVDFIYRGYLHPDPADEFKQVRPPDDHLLIHLPLEENLNETASNKTVTFTNGGSADKVTYSLIDNHQCAHFPGNKFGIKIAKEQFDDISGNIVNHDLSMSVWFIPMQNSYSNWNTYIRLGGKQKQAVPRVSLVLAGTYGNNIYAGTDDVNIGQQYGDTTPIESMSGRWFHQVVTYKEAGGTIIAYLNGTKVGQYPMAVSIDLTSGLTFAYYDGQCSDRYIHDFRMYDCVLTRKNVNWLYAHGEKQEHPLENEYVYYAAEQLQLEDEAIVSHTFTAGEGIVVMSNDIIYTSDFFKDTSIVGISLPSSVTTISYGSFSGCSGLALDELPEALETIEDNAFANCTSLTVSEIPENVSYIGDDAFSNCVGLTEIEFNGMPESIASSAFAGCSNLSAITVPWYEDDVDGAPWGAVNATIYYAIREAPPESNQVFYWAPEQQTLYSNTNVASHTFSNGRGVITYDSELNSMPESLRGTSITKVEIPDGVSGIGAYAFSNCKSLTSAILPSSIITFWDKSFSACSSLVMNEFPPNARAINGYAFSGCASLALDSLPSSIMLIYDYAFAGCSGLLLTDLPNSTSLGIGTDAFLDCVNMPLSSIPSGYHSMGESPFFRCRSIRSITISDGVDVNQIAGTLFNGCTNLTDIYVPWVETELDAYLAYTKFKATNATIHYRDLPSNQIMYFASSKATLHDSANVISHEDFDSTGNIYRTKGIITYSSPLSSMPSTLQNSDVVQIIVPSSVTKIEYGALSGNSSVQYVTMPYITEIDGYAFKNCSSLTMQFYNNREALPSTVTKIGNQAFWGCSNLTLSSLPPNLESLNIGTFYNCNKVTFKSIPSSVSAVKIQAFDGCSNITIDTIPSNVSSIEATAFKNCFSLSSMTILNKPNVFAGDAFLGCSGITDIYAHWYEDELSGAPWGAANATVHYLDEINMEMPAANEIWYYAPLQQTLTNESGVLSHTFSNGKGVVTYESELSSVPNTVFAQCSSITEVKLPNNITTIEYGSFALCKSLSSINWPSALTVISGEAFFDCNNLQFNKLPDGLTKINSQTFRNCFSLTGDISMPSSLAYIDTAAFKCCSGITSITIPSSVQTIREESFLDCSSLSSVTFEGMPKYIDATMYDNLNVFGGCSSLTDIYVPWYKESRSFYNIQNATIHYSNVETSMPSADEIWYYGLAKTNPTNSADIQSNTYDDITGKGVIKFNSDLINIPSGFISYLKDTAETSLNYLRLPDTVKTIGERAFYNLRKMNMPRLPNELEVIGSSAFYNCYAFTLSSLPSGLTTIYDGAFVYAVVTVNTFPASIDYIGNTVFGMIGSITQLTFNGTPSYIDAGAFISPQQTITDIYVPWYEDDISGAPWGLNPNYVTVHYAEKPPQATDEILYRAPNQATLNNNNGIMSHTFSNGKGIIKYSSDVVEVQSGLFAVSDVTKVELPSTVVSIGNSAFTNCSSLLKVDMPSSVESIDAAAFLGCSALNLSELPAELIKIEMNAFQKCSGLTLTTLPDNISSIDMWAFSNCENLALTKLPSSITQVNDFVFNECHNVALTSLPENITRIGEKAFYNCYDMAISSLPNNLSSVSTNAFYNCSGMPISALPTGAESLTMYDGSFYNCDAMTISSIPSSVVIAGRSFNGCSGLNTITFEEGCQLTSIWYPFVGCENLTDIYLPLTIDEYNNLQNKPSTLSAGNNAIIHFKDENIQRIKYSAASQLTLNQNNIVESHTFSNGSGIVTFNDEISEMPAIFSGTAIQSIEIPDFITSIGSSAFKNCSLLELSSIPSSVTSIEEQAFASCPCIVLDSIPSSVSSIGSKAFSNCTGLQNVLINGMQCSIAADAFEGCSNLTDIYCFWKEGDVANSPWCATNATIHQLDLRIHVPLKNNNLNDVINNVNFTLSGSQINDITFGADGDHEYALIPGKCSANASTDQYVCLTQLKANVPSSVIDIKQNNGFTMCMWFKPIADIETNALSTKYFTYGMLGEAGASGRTFNKAFDLAGIVKRQIYSGFAGTSLTSNSIGTATLTGNWWFSAVVYNQDSGLVSAVINNGAATKYTQSAAANKDKIPFGAASQDVRIAYGKRQCDTRYVHDFRIFQKALTINELNALYNRKI